jgi:hypothetical protein
MLLQQLCYAARLQQAKLIRLFFIPYLHCLPTFATRCDLNIQNSCTTFNDGNFGSAVTTMLQVPGEDDAIYVGNANGVLRCSESVPNSCNLIAKTTSNSTEVRAMAAAILPDGAGLKCWTGCCST